MGRRPAGAWVDPLAGRPGAAARRNQRALELLQRLHGETRTERITRTMVPLGQLFRVPPGEAVLRAHLVLRQAELVERDEVVRAEEVAVVRQTRKPRPTPDDRVVPPSGIARVV